MSDPIEPFLGDGPEQFLRDEAENVQYAIGTEHGQALTEGLRAWYAQVPDMVGELQLKHGDEVATVALYTLADIVQSIADGLGVKLAEMAGLE
jgi:hypothetical protein